MKVINKTRTDVVSKNVSQGCHKIRKSKIRKATLTLHSIKGVLCDFRSYLVLKKMHFHNISIRRNFIKIFYLMLECARKNLVKCDLLWPLVSFSTLWNMSVFHNVSIHIDSSYKIRNSTKNRKTFTNLEIRVTLCDLQWPLGIYFIKWKSYVCIMLAFISSFDTIRS